MTWIKHGHCGCGQNKLKLTIIKSMYVKGIVQERKKISFVKNV